MSKVIDLRSPVKSSASSSGMEASVENFLDTLAGAIEGIGEDGQVDLYSGEDLIDEALRDLALSAMAELLRAAEPPAENIIVDGVEYRRMKQRSRGSYRTLHGLVEVDRHLYRQTGVRNGPTLDPIAARCGIVDGGFTPKAAQLAGFLSQSVPSREAMMTCEMSGVLPYSRSSIFRVGAGMGQRWDLHRDDIEEELVSTFEIPEKARSLSLAIDRVSMPMAEDREPTEEDKKKGVARPISVQLRMAYCGVWTLHDAEGRALHSVRYAHVPEEGSPTIENQLACDVEALLETRPDLQLVTLADGAPEMQKMLDRALPPGRPAVQLLDYWHLTEKLSAAVKAVKGSPGKLWRDWKNDLKVDDHAIEGIEAKLQEWGSGYGPEELPEALHDALTYIENHRERLRYATPKSKGLPIASGAVEATCKTIVTVRFKRSGARWRPPGAQALLSLRALATSSRWRPAMRLLVERLPRDVTAVAA